MTQLEIQFFWPLTEQIPLDLDFTPSIEYNREMRNTSVLLPLSYPVTTNSTQTTWFNTTKADFVITSANSVGMLNIGAMKVSLQSKPKLYQRILYKLLGFKWEEK
jgi:hypothetical protein